MTTENDLIGKIEHFGSVKHCKIFVNTYNINRFGVDKRTSIYDRKTNIYSR